MITNHTQLLNYLIEKHSLKSYLEIGVRTTEQNFDRIKCSRKVGVDPCLKLFQNSPSPQAWKVGNNIDTAFYGVESDVFFEMNTCNPFDLIFIDGLHHADQVKRDFENSLRCLNDNGFIVIHDTLPELEEQTCVPRGEQKQWWGDVYKFAMTLREYSGIDFITYNFDCGCTVVWKSDRVPLRYKQKEQNWNRYKQSGMALLNVTNEPTF